jgi:type VI secretion system secreted protein Hcp
MAADMFLKMAGIKGESVDKVHKGEIEVVSWGWGVTQSGSTHGAAGGISGKPNVQDVSITKFVDRATPGLLTHCLGGKHIDEAVLTLRKGAGDKPLDYLKIKMNNAIVRSLQTGGSGGTARLQETIILNFAKIEFEYVPQKADGSGDSSTPITWDVNADAASK